jgi:SIR2-like domain
MVDWPEDLIRDIARRRCVIVVGSGVSAQSVGKNGIRPPTWRDFLKKCNDSMKGGALSHITKAIEGGDLLHACEWLQVRYEHTWTKTLRDAFSAPHFSPSEAHKTIARLDARILFSLNFEDILDRAVQEIHGGTCVTKRYYDEGVSEFLRGTDRYLIKVHGSLDEIEKIIFTQRQYAEARVKSAAFYSAFDSALMTNTFLFLGAGTQDPDINMILENQNFTYSKIHPHYFLAADGMHEDLKKSLRSNRNISVIEFKKKDDNYSGFIDAISELLVLVEEKRENLATSLGW